MAEPEKVLLAWSGGKDSALALHRVRKLPDLSVQSLLTTLSAPQDRVSMHGVRRALVEAQAAALELPLHLMPVGAPPAEPRPAGGGASPGGPAAPRAFTSFPSNEEYERKLEETLLHFKAQGVRAVVFGDIFLEDLKAYRDRLLAGVGLRGLYPLWKRDSRALMEEFLELGFRAVVVCVDSRVLDGSWAGRTVDRDFLAALPPGADPSGENGEFHTFVFDGPSFRRPVELVRGERVRQDRFWYCDLLSPRTGA